jgi:hypothetical protein
MVFPSLGKLINTELHSIDSEFDKMTPEANPSS